MRRFLYLRILATPNYVSRRATKRFFIMGSPKLCATFDQGIGLRELIKKYLRRCSVCKRLEGKFFEPPPASPLPDFRVSENPPFSNVGLGFIGPLLTRTSKDNEVVKSYICLFTCCSTRGIHLETCESLNVSSFRLLFRRFCRRRGLPVLLLSDNASTFKSASQEIRKIARSKEIKNYVANKGITWTFITRRASWMGGSWERMV